MEPQREILSCHACHGLQRDRHGEVSRRGSDIPVRLEERELAAVWPSVRRHQVSGPVSVARRREDLGLPRVTDREAERRLMDNRSHTARRHRAAARARGEAAATLGAPEVLGAVEVQGGHEIMDTVPEERIGTRTRRSRSELKVEPVILLRGGGTKRPLSPCERCTNCDCCHPRDY